MISFLVVLALFGLIFVTKLQGVIDVQLLAVALLALPGIFRREVIPPFVLQLFFVFMALFVYASIISIIYSGIEIIWPLKFMRTGITVLLLFYAFTTISQTLTYDAFCKLFVIFCSIHSIIIFLAILRPEFREFLYGLTGFEPRGPAWLRSPGLTVSYNTPAVLHITAIWLCVTRTNWPLLLRLMPALPIFLSLIFLGRTITYVGLALILTYAFFQSSFRGKMATVTSALLVIAAAGWILNGTFTPDSSEEKLQTTLAKAVNPLILTSDDRIDTYFQSKLAEGGHIRFSDNWGQLIFGRARSGNIGIFGPDPLTMSDIGFVNSTTANGIVVTFLLYAIYMWLLYLTRKGDWATVGFVIALVFTITWKETGFFTSHITQLLFILIFYQVIAKTNVPILPKPARMEAVEGQPV
jgi:hypothetical protein